MTNHDPAVGEKAIAGHRRKIERYGKTPSLDGNIRAIFLRGIGGGSSLRGAFLSGMVLFLKGGLM